MPANDGEGALLGTLETSFPALVVFGARSSGMLNEILHRRPSVSKLRSTLPLKCRTPDRRSLVPNPSRVGCNGVAPPLSSHSIVSRPDDSFQTTLTCPRGLESAPYFTAFV